jgi:hypothetical protein
MFLKTVAAYRFVFKQCRLEVDVGSRLNFVFVLCRLSGIRDIL